MRSWRPIDDETPAPLLRTGVVRPSSRWWCRPESNRPADRICTRRLSRTSGRSRAEVSAVQADVNLADWMKFGHQKLRQGQRIDHDRTR